MSAAESDHELMERVRARDTRAMEALLDRYSAPLFSIALRILRDRAEAENALQDAWLTAWRGAPTYDPLRSTVPRWLLAIARERALERMQILAVRRGDEEVPAADMPDDPATDRSRRHLADRVRAVLGSIGPQQRRVLEAAFFEGLSQPEIATQLKTPLSTVKTWTRQGLSRLRELMPHEEWA